LIIVAFSREIADVTQAEQPRNYTLVDLVLLDFIASANQPQIQAEATKLKDAQERVAVHPLEAKAFPGAERASVGICFATDLVAPKDSLLLNQYQLKIRNITLSDIEEKPDEARVLMVQTVEFRDRENLPPKEPSSSKWTERNDEL
jgi:hypothetical protein